MSIRILHKTFGLIILLLALHKLAIAQVVRVNGTVYERTERYGMAGVSVMNSAGGGTVTDSMGHYSIRIATKDSLSFSYQGKATMKFPVAEINVNRPFDIGLHVDIKVLPTVEVQHKSYKEDSTDFREEYKKVFNFNQDYIATGMGGVGVNLDALFSIRKAKRMEHFRQQLIAVEQDRYITHRFNMPLVRELTGLQSPALDTFMVRYRPTYEMLLSFENEYEFYEYIKGWGSYFSSEWKKEHP
ncbi:peptidase associated/transthyretin-like domain-containing protein [Chitinophaga sancti]|uniref:CarboxypepD_reg-like domain-containing protein n=1 Tax=Chitinophaga sancti TaxID=1004 RepID=A0A1K1NJ54_9BACT|nr:hypothetical protein [Chitinophaga sancti]WQD63170.1 hypothetical protein U0033_02095 [Chitinophaga sancti]WQG91205.1 hypothetical protein SR876_06820 [Chitinophaga sancti]SFW35498.1 hypothetical protein SAMN05661012_01365 [Chitinophaga sancti]